jgi:hypothetical protein
MVREIRSSVFGLDWLSQLTIFAVLLRLITN